ncbi:hypothetical protein PLICRDRAFT_34170 [Plicaturopsis crispa FD-325 SS-3]|nr:hypothetical protein PLICRDRAFT_34170 [Plicaturopsis crispa FD-325 SS-3]
MTVSIASTPYSSTATLAPANEVFDKPLVPASNIVEYIAATSSSTVYVYDLAEQAGFGTLTKSWSDSVVDLQTRAGAGLSLVGRLSEGTSLDAERGALLTAYTTPTGLAAMAHSLSYLPPASPTSRLVIQVPTVTPVGETFALSPTLASLSTALHLLPADVAILLSATPQETVDFTALTYGLTTSHVVHLFDQHSAAREVGHALEPAKSVSSLQDITAFEYSGDVNAHTVVVLLNGPLALAAQALAGRVPGLGVVSVRVLRPWDEAALRKVLPPTVRNVRVFDDVPNDATQGPLYIDVLGTFLDASVTAHRVVPAQTQDFLSSSSALYDYILKLVPGQPAVTPETDATKKLLWFSSPKSVLSSTPALVEKTFLLNRGLSSRSLTDYDVFSKAGGIAADRIVVSAHGNTVPIPIALPLSNDSSGEADFLGVLDHTLLKTHDVIQHAKPDSVVLVVTPWSSAELASNLSAEAQAHIRERRLRVCIIDAKGLAAKQGPSEVVLAHLAFLRLYLGAAATEETVLKLARASLKGTLEGVELLKANAQAWAGLVEVEFPSDLESYAVDGPPGEVSAPLKVFEFNAIAVETDEGDTVVNGARLSSWHDAAKHLIFPAVFTPPTPASSSTYAQDPALRPELADRTFLVTCTVNKRLTPLEYDRNVFHLEFDTAGTGLTYSIGEALGVHGWNDLQEVLDFCAAYGVDPQRLITIPVPGDEQRLHTRTVLQALQQQIDLFGRPPKAFYADLAQYATDSVDKHALQFIGSPEGASTFKKLSEKDTVTFADVLAMYPSARPGIEVLCELIGDVKPRHYSIASAQSVVGDRVDLLVVTVDWVTPSGSPRYGQCTRYLAGLKPGQKVTVSIKPSVMKLPPNDTQPIILAGLGTGAAPFRAFLQHRAWLAEHGVAVGPTYYYFGSRHQSQEYLYGEEIEAFIMDGTITRAGLAFSRDGAKKVYIQHKMLEDAEQLAAMLRDEQGVFYLCGPTWPVPDVYEALVGALVKYNGMGKEEAGQFLEGLKEEERYVLEVY